MLFVLLLSGCSQTDYSSCLQDDLSGDTIISDIECTSGSCGTIKSGETVNYVLTELNASCIDGYIVHPDGRQINFTRVNCLCVQGVAPSEEQENYCAEQREEVERLKDKYYFIYLPCFPCCSPP